eukprot:s6112_g5.t1
MSAKHVPRNLCPSLATHPCDSVLKQERSGGKHTGNGTCEPVVPEWVEEPMAAAMTRRKGGRARLCRDGEMPRRQYGDGATGNRPGLRQQQWWATRKFRSKGRLSPSTHHFAAGRTGGQLLPGNG